MARTPVIGHGLSVLPNLTLRLAQTIDEQSRSEADHRLSSRMTSATSNTILTAMRPKAIRIHLADQIIMSPPFGLRLAPT